ncbi:hypothetical protein KQX54_002775 [Cotesia glomerata]|uniref:Uncharacterized protein n=1 Tax=Cotesia glomerata TaxID=32391 RepID=A0AAV7IZE4_COTGL|nr:hypothetical protein KQX54_002775 [Cotesia glomerata]
MKIRFSSNQNDYDLVNSSEINWRFKRGDVENRDETCLNFDSTAESFFDYFILSVYWPPGLGYLYLTDKNKIRLNLANQKHWSIHGLWPSVINGEVPDKCHDLTQKFKFSVVHIKLAKDNLYGVLTNNWFNIVDMENPSSGIENFWRTEYDNHGACASHAQSIQDDVGYFRTAIKMLNDMSLATKIRESGLSDGGSILLGTLYDKLTQSIGAKLKIIPAFDKVRTGKLLLNRN